MLANPTERRAFDFLLRHGKCTAAALAREAGVPASTSSLIFPKLQKLGLAASEAQAPNGRGRPGRRLVLATPRPVLALQLDGSRAVGGVIGRDLRPLALAQIEHPPVATPQQAAAVARKLVAQLLPAARGLRLPGVGLAVNAVRLPGNTLSSSVAPWASADIESAFSKALHLPVRIVWPSRALVDYQLLEPGPGALLVRLHVGDGVSAHMALDGRPVRGATGLSGELGHISVAAPAPGAPDDGPVCGCGRRGCLEAYCSGGAIARAVVADLRAGAASSLDAATIEALPPRRAVDALWQAWNESDPLAQSTINRVLDRLAWSLALVVNLHDPQCVTLGGYVLAGHDAWVQQIIERSARWTLHASRRQTRILASPSALEHDLRMIACEFFYREQLQRTPLEAF